jgi:hypothetical protein
MSLERRLAKLAEQVGARSACSHCHDHWVAYVRRTVWEDGRVEEEPAEPCPACGEIERSIIVEFHVVPDADR